MRKKLTEMTKKEVEIFILTSGKDNMDENEVMSPEEEAIFEEAYDEVLPCMCFHEMSPEQVNRWEEYNENHIKNMDKKMEEGKLTSWS
jgi:hypothetical protein